MKTKYWKHITKDIKKLIVKINLAMDKNGNAVRKCFFKDGTYIYTRQADLFRIGEYDKFYQTMSGLYQSKL